MNCPTLIARVTLRPTLINGSKNMRKREKGSRTLRNRIRSYTMTSNDAKTGTSRGSKNTGVTSMNFRESYESELDMRSTLRRRTRKSLTPSRKSSMKMLNRSKIRSKHSKRNKNKTCSEGSRPS